MIGLDPCGYAVDMVRSCYLAQSRMQNGNSEAVDIRWYFVDNDTPFLPYPTVFNSNNWLERRGYVDDPSVAGEVIGGRRRWFDGHRPAGAFLGGPCGSPDDFLGNGSGLIGSPNLDSLPPCCTLIDLLVENPHRSTLTTDIIFNGSDLGGTTVSGYLTSTQSFEQQSAWSDYITFGFIFPQLDLWTSLLTPTPDSLTDFVLLTNPVLTAGNLGTTGPAFLGSLGGTTQANYNFVYFLGSDIVGGLPATAYGWVLSDGYGDVLAWSSFDLVPISPISFYNDTDSLTIQMTEQMIFDYL